MLEINNLESIIELTPKDRLLFCLPKKHPINLEGDGSITNPSPQLEVEPALVESLIVELAVEVWQLFFLRVIQAKTQ